MLKGRPRQKIWIKPLLGVQSGRVLNDILLIQDTILKRTNTFIVTSTLMSSTLDLGWFDSSSTPPVLPEVRS